MSSDWDDSRSRAPAWHLLWAVPLGVVAAAGLLAVASFLWCGIAACTMRDHGSPGVVAVFLLLAAVAVAVPVGCVPWTRRRGLRFGVALAIGIAAAVAGASVITGL